MDELAHVGTEDVLAHDDEEQRAHGADEQGDEHVLGIVDAHTGHGLIGAEHGQGGLLEGDEGHAHLGGEHDTEHHHGGVTVAFLEAADFAHAVQDAPADDGGRRGAGQTAEDEDGAQEGVGEYPGPPGNELAGDEPQGNELGQAIMADGGAEDEDEEHHLDHRVTEALVEQHHGLHAADEHQGQQTGQAGPDDLDTDPAVEHAQEDTDKIHPQGRQRFHGR